MTYHAEIWRRTRNEDLDVMDCTFDNLQDAIEWIEHHGNIKYASAFSGAYINGKKLRGTGVLSIGKVVGDDGEPFCTNEVWHNVFAPVKYPRIEAKP